MKSGIYYLSVSAFALTMLNVQAHAQVFAPAIGNGPASATGTFTIPQSFDPVQLTYISDGQMLDHTDSSPTSLGDNAGMAITGQTFYANSSPGGLEVHAQLPLNSPRLDVVEFDLYTTYAGAFEFNTDVGPFTGATPWDVNRINPIAGFVQGFRFTATTPNAFPINNYRNDNFFGFYALITVDLTDRTDPTGFLNSRFTTQGFTTVQTPEPGTIALLGALAVSGGVTWRRRRRTV